MKKFALLLVGVALYVHAGLAKSTATVSGTVLDTDSQPLAYANIILHEAVDSSIVKLELTDEEGYFKFDALVASQYFVEVSFVGLPSYFTEAFSLIDGGNHIIPTIELTAQNNELDAVTVVATKPLLEMKPDKMVMNVENSVTAAGNDALELLRKAPGVVVDNSENISLLGKAGVQVYIDGKPSPLGGADLAAFLKTVQAAEIESIEIITNPSSKYDAQGNAGIINIKMKRDKRLGANANINLGYQQGEKMGYNGGISGNYKNKQLNVFGSYSYFENDNINTNDFYREQFGFIFDQRSVGENTFASNNYRIGSDFFLGKKHTLGFLVNGFLSTNDRSQISRAGIGTGTLSVIDSVLIGESYSDRENTNNNFNLNYRFDNGEGKTLNIDADYGLFRIENTEFQPNTYYNAAESVIFSESIADFNTPTNIDIATFKIDYEQPLGKGKLGVGAKVAYVVTDNTFDYFDVIDGISILNRDRSNQFEYTENVNALYANYQQQVEKFGFQFGLRMENTNSEGDLTSFVETENDNVKRNYLDFFPSAGITYQANEKNSFQLNYSRRINRPSYQDLNPFRMRLDELTFEKGNPFLRPEYTNKFQLTHTFNYSLNTSLSFDYTKDLIARLTDAETEKSAFITYQNVADQYSLSLNVSGGIPINKWWSTYTSLTGFYQQNNGMFEDGKELDIEVVSFNAYSQHNFTLPMEMNLEISGFYTSPSIWEGAFRMQDMWALNAGLSKKVLDGRGSIKLSVTDIFRTQVFTGDSDFGDLMIRVNGGWDSRRFRANFSYLLGNNQVKSRRRNTGLEAESNRVKSGN